MFNSEFNCFLTFLVVMSHKYRPYLKGQDETHLMTYQLYTLNPKYGYGEGEGGGFLSPSAMCKSETWYIDFDLNSTTTIFS